MPVKKEEPEKEPTPVKIISAPEPETVPVVRSQTEQSVIDELGTDPSKYKEGTHEHDLVAALPENIAKKQKEEAEKAAKDKK